MKILLNHSEISQWRSVQYNNWIIYMFGTDKIENSIFETRMKSNDIEMLFLFMCI